MKIEKKKVTIKYQKIFIIKIFKIKIKDYKTLTKNRNYKNYWNIKMQ